jgi:manganese/zinc/iron transport system permease protein
MDGFLSDLLRLLSLQDPNTRVVLLGVALLGLTSGVIGSFAVLRRRALIGDALAHAALPGLCMAYFVVGDRSFVAFLLGALVFGVAGVLCITFIRTHTRVKEDAAIGLVLSSFFGLGIVLSRIIQNQPTGNRAGLDTYIFGKTAGMVRQDVLLIAIVSAIILALVIVLFKELSALCFDRDFAATQGWPVTVLDVLLMGLICVCTVIGLPAVGVVLMAALLIIPAAAARFWTERLSIMLLVAGAIGLVSGLFGSAASAVTRFPAGPAIVLVAATLFVVSMLFAPGRGIVADVLRKRSISRRIAIQHVLRGIYEIGESAGDFDRPVSFDQLLRVRSWRGPELWWELDRATRRGLVHFEQGAYRLTGEGLTAAARLVRTHRLWEIFLMERASIAADHVDRDADEIEHFLPPALIAQLEEELRRQGRLPQAIPLSPHRLPGEGIAAGPTQGTA